jgi:tRNA(fMet)-specific endonuclease VapC
MTNRYLLDTNVLSEPLRVKPNSTILSRLHQYRADVVIPTIVWHELWFGCLRLTPSRRRADIEDYLTGVVALMPMLSYDADAAHWHASERARLTVLGQTPPYADGQIAAIAKINNLTLITANVSDYAHFADLQVEDWSEHR